MTGIELISKAHEDLFDTHLEDRHRAFTFFIEETTDLGQYKKASLHILDDINHGNEWSEGWNQEWLKDVHLKAYHERLAIAGAFIASELDRLNKDNKSNER